MQATTLFEAVATAVAPLHDVGWTGKLPPDAVLRVEVQLPPVVHEGNASERWTNGPSVSPKQELLQQPFRRS
jgi:hypothetical protein